MIIPINESSAEIIIRNAISNINMTITNKQGVEDSNEDSNLEFLGNLINNKIKSDNQNVMNLTNLNTEQTFEKNDDTFFLSQEEVTLNRNSDSSVFAKSTTLNKGNILKLSKVILIYNRRVKK